jgi:hypothetical protein
VIPLKFFPEILSRYFPSDPPQILSRNTVQIFPQWSPLSLSRNIAQIFHWYISKYFLPKKYLHNHFSSPYKYFLHNYSSSLLFIDTIHHCYYLSLLFIDHPITPNFNYSSIMLSNPPKTCQTHIPVIRTPVTMIFLPVGNFPSGHPSQVSPSWARLTLRFLRTRLPNSDSNNSCF